MPASSITPNSISPAIDIYTISNSKGMIVDLNLPIDGITREFTIQYPTTAAASEVTLLRGGTSLNLLTLATPDIGTFPQRRISVSTTPVGTNTVLTVDIKATVTEVGSEAWTIRVRRAAVEQYVFSREPGASTIIRVMCDPVAGFAISAPTLSGGSVKEKNSITLTSNPALGTVAAPTVVGTPSPTTSYRWSFSGSIAIPAFPSCGLSPNFVFIAPSIYKDTAITLTQQVWFDSPCPTPGFLNTTSSPQNLTIKPTAQRLMLVLDRTGSMSGSKWENAKVAARMLTQLFAALRSNVSEGDKVGILVFEDSKCTWHSLPRDSSMQTPVLTLSDTGTADTQIQTLNLGNPGACTPIGDALIQAMQNLNTSGIADTPNFTIILLTDGIENSGSVYIDPETIKPSSGYNASYNDPPGFNPLIFSSARAAFPDVNSRLRLYTIGVGTDSLVSTSVLNRLKTEGTGAFRLVIDPTDIPDGIAQMVSFSQTANKITPYACTNPDPNPDPCVPPKLDPDNASILHKRYFQVDAKVNRLVLMIEGTNPSDSIELAYRTFNSGTMSYEGSFTPLTGVTKPCPTHLLRAENLAEIFGAGNADNVPSTEWRVVLRSGGAAKPIPSNKILIFVDLYVLVDIVFNKPEYRTGDRMIVTARLRAGDQPITGAKVFAELARPGEGLGTFLAINSQRFQVASATSLGMTTTFSSTGSGDPPNAKLTLLRRLLNQNDMDELPYLKPPVIFADGSNELYDDGTHEDGFADDGNYANVFTKVDKEGTYTWRFTISGNLPDGSPFNREITLSTWVGVKVDPASSIVIVNYGLQAPQRLQAAQIFVTPKDRNGEYLGPFWTSEIELVTSSGQFQGDLISLPDGRYTQILEYPQGTVPIVTVKIQDQELLPIIVAPGCLGRIVVWVRALLEWLLNLARGS